MSTDSLQGELLGSRRKNQVRRNGHCRDWSKRTDIFWIQDAILNFLYDHIDRSIDSQVRARWEPYTVVLWDNRVTAHVSHCVKFIRAVRTELACSPPSWTSSILKSVATVYELRRKRRDQLLRWKDSRSTAECARKLGLGYPVA